MTTMLWRGLCIVPLLFILSVNCAPGGKHAGGKPAGGKPPGGNVPNKGIPQPAKPAGGNPQPIKPPGNAQPVIPPGGTVQPPPGGNPIVTAQTDFKGKWDLFCPDSGVSAMHIVLLPTTTNALFFDATIMNVSRIKLPPGPCRRMPGTNLEDCWAHSVLFDFETAKIKPQKLVYDTWCSSGALDLNGKLVSTGGYLNGSDTVRYLDNCPDYCTWEEFPGTLGNGRWYSTQVSLADGRFLVFGGRGFQSYEFVPPKGQKNAHTQVIDFHFLRETNDPEENNLYPFINLTPEGFLFVFANYRSVLLDTNTHKIVHEFPQLHPGGRNYPASAASTMIPIMLQPDEKRPVIPAEVLICGGADRGAYVRAEKWRPKVFLPALKDCAVIDITNRKAQWKRFDMPTARVMSDALNLPTGDILLINGAKLGTSGWGCAIDPNFAPHLYRHWAPEGAKFTELNPTGIARMYHSVSAVLPDGKILVAGSNTHNGYIYLPPFPTETRVEKFTPPYLDPKLDIFRTEIVLEKSANKINYGMRFEVTVRGGDNIMDRQKLQVNIYHEPFTTHGISMNQRQLYLGIYEVKPNSGGPGITTIALQAPPNGNVAPPGYHMLWVVYNGVPCKRAIWVHLIK